MNEIIDNYQEHKFHDKPYWKGMKTCSECYKAHKEVLERTTPHFQSEETENALKSCEQAFLHRASD